MRRGFTIIEILISMMFLSLGIMGVIGFFFLGVNDNRQSVRLSRATEYAKCVREALANAVRFPERNPPPQDSPWYRFELSSTVENPASFVVETQALNGFYFNVDDQQIRMRAPATWLRGPFTNNGIPLNDRVLDLPFEAFNRQGVQYRRETWPMRDTFFPYVGGTEFDEDDSQYYSFRILIRRNDPVGNPPSTGFIQPGHLFDVTVYIFRQFVDGLIQPPEKYDPANGTLLVTDAGGVTIDECVPIITYHFLLGGA